MKTSRILFPDGQNHIRVDPDELYSHPEGFDLTHRIRNAAELLDLELVVDAAIPFMARFKTRSAGSSSNGPRQVLQGFSAHRQKI